MPRLSVLGWVRAWGGGARGSSEVPRRTGTCPPPGIAQPPGHLLRAFLSALLPSRFPHLGSLGSPLKQIACTQVYVSGLGGAKKKQSPTVSPRGPESSLPQRRRQMVHRPDHPQLPPKHRRARSPAPGPLSSLLKKFLRWKPWLLRSHTELIDFSVLTLCFILCVYDALTSQGPCSFRTDRPSQGRLVP